MYLKNVRFEKQRGINSISKAYLQYIEPGMSRCAQHSSNWQQVTTRGCFDGI